MQMLGGAIAHEVRTPLSGLIMSAQAINEVLGKAMEPAKSKNRKRMFKMDKDDYDYLIQVNESIQKIGKQGVNTVDSILTSLKSSVVGDEKKLYLIKECVEQTIAECSIFNENVKNIEISIKKNFRIKCSLHYFQHLLFNLIKNSYKYGGANVRIKIWTKGSNLHFKDYGKGISREDLSNIFDRFYTKSKTGTGIGLAFCKMVMKDLGGDIECKSELGKYAEFILVFPKSYT